MKVKYIRSGDRWDPSEEHADWFWNLYRSSPAYDISLEAHEYMIELAPYVSEKTKKMSSFKKWAKLHKVNI